MTELATISEMFDYDPGNHGLTEEVMYDQQPLNESGRIPVFSGSGNNEIPSTFVRSDGHTKDGSPIIYFDGPCLILTKDGSAGLISYKGPGIRFTINHHACVLRVKPEWANKLDLIWFSQQFQSRLLSVATSKSDNRVFSVEWFDRLKFSIPKREKQVSQRLRKQKMEKSVATAEDAARSLREIIAMPMRIPATRIIYRGPIGPLFKVHGGNTGLTEQFIYHNLPLTDEDAATIRSGATMAANDLGRVSATAILPNGKPLKIFAEECILVTRKGFYAGTVSHWPGDELAPNDDINVLTPRAEFKDKINLKWFAIQYAPQFRKGVSSLLHNPTFSQQWLDRIAIALPDRKYQDAAMRKISRWQDAAKELEAVARNATELLESTFPVDDAA